MVRVLCVFGTRPEAIKMAPLIRKLREASHRVSLTVCVTGQHREMLDQVLSHFHIQPDIDLNVMRPGQSLSSLTANLMEALDRVMITVRPNLVLVQGDTTSAMVGALAAYYHRIPVGHVEAGLRSRDRYNPFPEEINRRLISTLATLHFAPTQAAVDALRAEGHDDSSVYLTGNTVVDALFMTLEQLGLGLPTAQSGDRYRILVTAHRRENFDQALRDICRALRALADRHQDLEIVFPVHLNPNVQRPVRELLSGHERIQLIAPLDYPELVRLLHGCWLVLTDSGGLQEEAPALGKPVLVMRARTERPEGVAAGVAKLVGSDAQAIVDEVESLLNDKGQYQRMARAVSPYGDGRAAERIVRIIVDRFDSPEVRRQKRRAPVLSLTPPGPRG